MEAQQKSLRPLLHYTSASIILAVYGVQVCPFLDTLTVAQLVVPIVIGLVIQYMLRKPLCALVISSAPSEHQTLRVFGCEFAQFMMTGAVLAAYNFIVYDFPWISGSKVFIGFTMLGFFAAIDLALEWQRNIVDHICRTGQHMKVDENYFPLSGKLGVFASISVVFILSVVFMVISKDLFWLAEVGRTVSYEDAQIWILAEIAFVVGVILGHVLNVIYSYVRNLRRFLDNENGVLMQATRGELDGFVPVGTNDEFGVMALHTNEMVKGLRETTEEIRRTRDVSILTLASLAETRDNETGAHILRTQRYVKALAEELQSHPSFAEFLSDENIDLLYKSAPLHDIGKVGIPDSILLKPGKLTAEEFEIMKTHAALGAEALRVSEKELGSNSFLRFAREISLSHHEKWDGSGYPSGLKGGMIPVSGRLMAVADVYDALISKRVYKKAFTHDDARNVIIEGKGSHFDPDIVEAFIAIEDQFKQIAADFADKPSSESSEEQPEAELAIA